MKRDRPTTDARTCGWWFLLAVALLGCNKERSRNSVRTPALEGEIARVGSATVSRAIVSRVALERSVPVPQALQALIDDQLLALGARSGSMDRDRGVRWALASALARQIPLRLFRAARLQGAPRDDELGFRRVVHAVVMRSNAGSAADALQVASALARVVSGAVSPDDFLSRARSVPHERARVIAQFVGPFDAAGKAPEGATGEQGIVDPTFVAASFRLERPGDTSPIVETSFGWHVIRMVEVTPCPAAELERRRQDLANDVTDIRARGALAETLRVRRERAQVRVEADADTLQARVSVAQ